MAQVDLGMYLPATEIPEGRRLLETVRAGRTLGLNERQKRILRELLPSRLIVENPDGSWARGDG